MIELLTPQPTTKRHRRMRSHDYEFAIYFDIDGCFHQQGAAQISRQGDILPTSQPLFTWANEFEDIIKPYHNVALVCHSMWRLMMPMGVLYHALPPVMQERFLDCTSGNDRYESITSHADSFGYEQYIIIDDSPAEFPRGLNNFIECNSSTGMSCEIALAGLRHMMTKKFGPPPPPLARLDAE